MWSGEGKGAFLCVLVATVYTGPLRTEPSDPRLLAFFPNELHITHSTIIWFVLVIKFKLIIIFFSFSSFCKDSTV